MLLTTSEHFLEPVLAPGDDADGRALLGQHRRERGTDPRRRAGHECDLALQCVNNEFVYPESAREGEALVELGERADLFVLEAAGTDQRPIPGHLTPRRAGRIAAQAQARHVLLTHFYPETLAVPIQAEAQEAFEGRVTLAEDGSVLTLAR